MFAKLFFANVIIIIFFAKVLPHFKTFQRDRLVDVEKCCKTRIFLQRSVPIQPKTSNILLVPMWQKRDGPEGHLVVDVLPRVREDHGRRHGGSSSAPGFYRPPHWCSPATAPGIGKFCKFLAKFSKFLAGSFPAASKRSFARKYAFDSIFQAL